MKIAIASDHGGFEYKKTLIEYLEKNGYEFEDFGTYSSDSCDYPDYIYPCAKAVADKKFDRGIVICGTGIGVSMVANKVKGIRCALANDYYSAKMTREHNNANMLAMGARVIGLGTMQEIVEVFLNTEYLGERHQRRLDKLAEIEEKFGK